MVDPIEIRAIVGAEKVSREQVRAWESRRAAAVLGKFAARLGRRGMAELMPDRAIDELLGAPLDVQRSALTTLKIRLGHAGVYAMLRRELALSERMARMGVAVSRGRTKHAATCLEVPNYSAERFATWFDNLTATNAETDMIDACPDHYLLRGLPDGRLEVVETTGGSPAAARFLVDYSGTENLTIPIDPSYPIQIAGQALLDDGLVIGGVRHQFRDRDGTLEALLTVEFPGTLPARLIRQHQWHLACEFSNWMIAAAPVAATS
ncbi:hypothetical protein [Nocardia lijiangensis]|uniref:hypothetical protein n=1 Tax=Nocardia lijiangensis TaxID=299618 RepID=UPI00082F5E36|nr:hypothetical protein [Nocardia lijiangensis]